MNNQEAFDGVWDWFVVEKHRPGTNPDGVGCAYYIDDVTRCAIGCLLPISLAKGLRSYEGIGVVLKSKGMVIAQHFEGVNHGLLRALQRAHDGSAYATSGYNPEPNDHETFLTLLEGRLEGVAQDYNLEVPSISPDAAVVEQLLEEITLEPAMA